MTTDTAPPPVAPPADERVRQVGLVSRLLARPEVGAIVAVVLVYAFLAVVAFDNNFVSWQATAAVLNTAAPLGILNIEKRTKK